MNLSFNHIKLEKICALSSTILTTNVLTFARSYAKNTKKNQRSPHVLPFIKKMTVIPNENIQLTFTPQFWICQEVTFPT